MRWPDGVAGRAGGVLYYAQGHKVARMKARRTKDALEAHGFGLEILAKLDEGDVIARCSDDLQAQLVRSKVANLTARGTLMVVDDVRELMAEQLPAEAAGLGADTGGKTEISRADAHAAARKDLEAVTRTIIS